jgi:hypothetical protein
MFLLVGVSFANNVVAQVTACLPVYRGVSFKEVEIIQETKRLNCSYELGAWYQSYGVYSQVSGPWKLDTRTGIHVQYCGKRTGGTAETCIYQEKRP